MFNSKKFAVLNLASVLMAALVSPSAFAIFPNLSDPTASPGCENSFDATMRALPAAIKGSDGRITIEEKGKNKEGRIEKLRREYPTRQIYCDGQPTNVNVVFSADTILMSAHTLYDENCKLRPNAKDCFVNDWDGEQQ
jgi:hypothetical protein